MKLLYTFSVYIIKAAAAPCRWLGRGRGNRCLPLSAKVAFSTGLRKQSRQFILLNIILSPETAGQGVGRQEREAADRESKRPLKGRLLAVKRKAEDG